MLKFLSSLKPADLVTLMNAASGILSIYFTIQEKYDVAICCILTAIVIDFLDGKVARLTKGSTKLGHDLDSLADAISFGAAPAAFLVGLNGSILATTIAVIFALCGVLRLARFNVAPIKSGYEGVPIPIPSIFIAIYFFANFPAEYLPWMYLIFAVLMISSIRIKKAI